VFIEKEFKHPNTYIAFLLQLTQISEAFKLSFKEQKSCDWLVQTLSYLHIVLKLLRISYLEHNQIKETRERLQREIADREN